MASRGNKVTILDCKQCGRTGIGPASELRRFGWRSFGEHACPTCQGLSGEVVTTTDHVRAVSHGS